MTIHPLKKIVHYNKKIKSKLKVFFNMIFLYIILFHFIYKNKFINMIKKEGIGWEVSRK